MGDRSQIRYHRSDSGFTVIEMMVALSLLVVAIVPLAGILTTSLRSTVTTSTRMLARQVGATEIDKARSMAFEAVGIMGVNPTFATSGPSNPDQSFQIGPDAGQTGLYAGPQTIAKTTQAGTTDFQVTRDVRKIASRRSLSEELSYTKKVVITVSWTSPEPAGSEEFTTIIGATDMAS